MTDGERRYELILRWRQAKSLLRRRGVVATVDQGRAPSERTAHPAQAARVLAI
ncbi:hypothetical protein [Nocardia araoensis]|uniref:hypothetical protein n=1 Tax=Nocardia araoensis TaxID=228600 RepID=UPI0002F3216C|nr:hypothetical protein [Nocardia araoensis]